MTEQEVMSKEECALRYYHKSIYASVTDYPTIIANKTEVSEGIYAYKCPGQTIYLDSDAYAVTYDRQIVDTEENAYYYKFTDDDDIETDMAYEYVTTYEWQKTEENCWFLYCVHEKV